MHSNYRGLNMEEFKEKYNDLLKRGYDISFYDEDNFNIFTKVQEKYTMSHLKRMEKNSFAFHQGFLPSKLS